MKIFLEIKSDSRFNFSPIRFDITNPYDYHSINCTMHSGNWKADGNYQVSLIIWIDFLGNGNPKDLYEINKIRMNEPDLIDFSNELDLPLELKQTDLILD